MGAFFQARHVPAARVRTTGGGARAIRTSRAAASSIVTHRRAGVEGPFAVPLAAFKFAHGGPSIETPPPRLGADTDSVLAELGYAATEIAALRAAQGDLTATPGFLRSRSWNHNVD